MPAGTFTGEKILIIMMKDGGEDGVTRYDSRDTTLNQQMVDLRPTLSRSNATVAAATARHIGSNWCLHPNLADLKALWDDGDMIITHRVGAMWEDCNLHSTADIRTSMGAFYNGPILHPTRLGAHNTQQYAMASQITRDHVIGPVAYTTTQDGFIGRLADEFAAFNGNLGSPSAAPPGMSMSFQAGVLGLFGSLVQTSKAGERGLGIGVFGSKFNRNFTGSTRQAPALTCLDAINAVPQSDPRRELFRTQMLAAKEAVAFFQPVAENANASYTVDASFANPSGLGSWPNLFRTVARAIEQRATGLGLPRRTVFIVNRNAYDTHSVQASQLNPLLTEENVAIPSFRNAMMALDGTGALWNNIIVMDLSEFGRPTKENGALGTDHGWAGERTAWGGGLRGFGVDGSNGEFGDYVTSHHDGTTPYRGGTGSHDITGGMAGAGSHIPFYSWEQYIDPFLRWFGADNADIAIALPRRAEFGTSPNVIAP